MPTNPCLRRAPDADPSPAWALFAATAVAVAARIVVFVWTAFVPLTNEQGAPISPLLANSGIDLAHYQAMRALYFGDPEAAIAAVGALFNGQSALTWGQAMFAGPALPFLLEVFDYRPGHALPLALLYLAIGCGLAALWLAWLARQGASPGWLLLFALLPNPIWFMLNVSTDLPFAAATALFYLAYFSGPPTSRRIAACIALVVLALAIRPNAAALALFLLLDLAWRSGGRRGHIALLAGLAALLAPAAVFYGPYLLSFVLTSTAKPLYFGLSQDDFLAGVFPWLPEPLDRALSLVALLGAKALCLVGLRPSVGDTPTALVLLRAAPGLILLPGLYWSLFRADRSHRLLMAIFIAPILAGATQDRYMLPVLPILFLYGCRAWAAGAAWLRARLTPQPPLAQAARPPSSEG